MEYLKGNQTQMCKVKLYLQLHGPGNNNVVECEKMITKIFTNQIMQLTQRAHSGLISTNYLIVPYIVNFASV